MINITVIKYYLATDKGRFDDVYYNTFEQASKALDELSDNEKPGVFILPGNIDMKELFKWKK